MNEQFWSFDEQNSKIFAALLLKCEEFLFFSISLILNWIHLYKTKKLGDELIHTVSLYLLHMHEFRRSWLLVNGPTKTIIFIVQSHQGEVTLICNVFKRMFKEKKMRRMDVSMKTKPSHSSHQWSWQYTRYFKLTKVPLHQHRCVTRMTTGFYKRKTLIHKLSYLKENILFCSFCYFADGHCPRIDHSGKMSRFTEFLRDYKHVINIKVNNILLLE